MVKSYSTAEREFSWCDVIPGDMVWVYNTKLVTDYSALSQNSRDTSNAAYERYVIRGYTDHKPCGTPILVIAKQTRITASGFMNYYLTIFEPFDKRIITMRVSVSDE